MDMLNSLSQDLDGTRRCWSGTLSPNVCAVIAGLPKRLAFSVDKGPRPALSEVSNTLAYESITVVFRIAYMM
jgi:hypothetical protein